LRIIGNTFRFPASLRRLVTLVYAKDLNCVGANTNPNIVGLVLRNTAVLRYTFWYSSRDLGDRPEPISDRKIWTPDLAVNKAESFA
jgi:hypothetical protein